MRKARERIKVKKAAFYDSEYGSNTYLQEAALYETMMYLHVDKYYNITEGETTVKDIVERSKYIVNGDVSLAPELTEGEREEIAAYLPTIEAMVKSLESKDINVSSAVINDLSWNLEVDIGKTKGVKFPLDGVQICSFIRDEYLFTSNRGTPAGSWLDNAYALIGRLLHTKTFTNEDGKKWKYLSPMQVKHLQYSQYIQNKYKDSGLTAVAGGHSKGANGAQLQALMFPEFYKAGYSFDGQGMSPEFIKECKKNWGEEEFQRRCSNLYGINFVND